MAENFPVYVVDDDEAVRDSLSLLLTCSGFAVQNFASARDFLEYCGGRSDGCLIFDLHMPEMSGAQMLRHLRADGNSIVAIAISGKRDQATDAELKRDGAFAVLSKPFDDEQFLALIRKVLETLRP